MGSVYLGLDIGTTSAKCLAVGEGGEILAFAQYPYPLCHPQQGWAEQDAEDYWRGLVDVVRRCVGACKERGRTEAEVAALAMSTQGDTLIMVDECGQPVAPAISWMDTRAERECRELLAETGKSFWYRNTGIGLTALSSACKMRWLAENAADLRARVHRFCWVADFLAQRLCGRFVADVPSASWTPLFSPVQRRWSEPVIRLLGVARESLPETAESGTIIGELVPDAATALGLRPDTKLVAGAFDQAAAAYGAGARAGLRSVLSCGTAWVLYVVSSTPVIDEREQIPVCCHVTASEWGMVLPFTGGAAYDWLQRTFRAGPPRGEGRAEPLIFIPHLYGGLSPDWRGESKGSLLGLTLAHTYADVEVALMRGLAFEARRNVEAAERLCGQIACVRMVGGASKSAVWPQMIANVLGSPVEVSDWVESACYGAAKLVAGERASQWDAGQEVREFVPILSEVEAEERHYAKYVRCYAALLALYAEYESADRGGS